MTEDDRVYRFGGFTLLPARRELRDGGGALKIGSRAFDILTLLVDRAGDLVPRDALLAHVWPGVHVDEGGLRVHMAALRKLLGDGRDGSRFIVNEPGRGYRFVAAVSRDRSSAIPRGAEPGPAAGAVPAGSPPRVVAALPRSRTRVIGRGDVVAGLDELLLRYRLVTLTGPGGMGKTTVALAYAGGVAGAGTEVVFVDFGPVTEPSATPNTIAAALGFPIRSDDETASVLGVLRGRSCLLVLDCCEHVIDAVAELAERILDEAPGVRLLVTSREPLRVSGEYVHRLGPLGFPAPEEAVGPETLARYPAMELLVERVAATSDGFEPDAADLAQVAAICRRLDGVALAIELAAAAVPLYGLADLAERLAESFAVLTRGRRTALPRQQTLQLTIAWSVDLLPADERLVLARLAVFAGSFSIGAAEAVAGAGVGGARGVVASVASLVDKSLLIAVPDAATTRYRLLDSTRDFAREMLRDSGEEGAAALRHARHFAAMLRRQRLEAPSEPFAGFRADLENVRAALVWAFSPAGDAATAIELASAAAPLFLDLSLLVECTRWAEAALNSLGPARRDYPQALDLETAFAVPRLYTRGNLAEVRASLYDALAAAEAAGDLRVQIHILEVLYVFHLRVAEFHETLAVAGRSAEIIRAAPDLRGLEADWMFGLAHYFAGDHALCVPHLRRSLETVSPTRRTDVYRYGSDKRVHAHNGLVRSLWMQGFADEARRLAERNLVEASELGHPVGHTIALMWMTPVFFWTGELGIAADKARELIFVAERSSQQPAKLVGLAYDGIIAGLSGQPARAVQAIEASIDGLIAVNNRLLHVILLGHLAGALVAGGEASRALGVLDSAEAHALHYRDLVNMPLLKLLRGRALALRDGGWSSAAAAVLHEALAWADRQGARAYRLEAQMLLVEAAADGAAQRERRDGLAALYATFTEGLDTLPLRHAASLLGA